MPYYPAKCGPPFFPVPDRNCSGENSSEWLNFWPTMTVAARILCGLRLNNGCKWVWLYRHSPLGESGGGDMERWAGHWSYLEVLRRLYISLRIINGISKSNINLGSVLPELSRGAWSVDQASCIFITVIITVIIYDSPLQPSDISCLCWNFHFDMITKQVLWNPFPSGKWGGFVAEISKLKPAAGTALKISNCQNGQHIPIPKFIVYSLSIISISWKALRGDDSWQLCCRRFAIAYPRRSRRSRRSLKKTSRIYPER